ncbi:MAG: T9SS type A sorting domain-containing protein [Hymenobacter sp.]|nr:T9SS type A sorting domain-containing protein [Hymenobacter sp.]
MRHRWDLSANRWIDGVAGARTYDARGNTAQIVYTDSATNAPLEKELYIYNAQNLLTEYVQQLWSVSTYENAERAQSTYDAQGNLTLDIYQEWVGNAWVTRNGVRFTSTYNPAGVLTSQVYESYDEGTGIWEPQGRALYTVDASNRWSEIIAQRLSNGSYVNEERIVNITWYNWTKLLPSYYEVQEWDVASGTWNDSFRSSSTYQPNGSSVEISQYLAAPNTWINESRITSTYDNFGNQILDQSESWDNNAWAIFYSTQYLLAYTTGNQVRRTVEQSYDITLAGYENYSLTTYDNFLTLGTRKATGLEVAATLHPNPTLSTTTLDLAGLREQGTVQAEVLSSVGQVVQVLTLRPRQGVISQELNLSTLPAGIYTVRLRTAEGIIAKRVVKQ